MITLVKDGHAEAVLIVAPDIGQPASQAIADMVHAVETMTGAILPVHSDSEQSPSLAQVHIGATSLAAKHGLPKDLPINGYRLSTLNGNCLMISANASLGLSHAIYDVLTNEMDAMWGMADPIFTDIPARKTLVIDPADRTEQPAFGFRVWSGVDSNWLRRNRLDDGSRGLPFYGHGHNLFNVLPPSKYADHPEFYAMTAGKRTVPDKDGHTPIQPCLTNPEVIRITLETVRQFFDSNPNVSTYSLCPNDSANFCECPSCRELDDGVPEYRGRRMNSDSYFHYIEAVARELLKSHPDRYVGTYAYWTTELPPRRIQRLPSNVVVYLTQDSSQYDDPAYEQRDHHILESWSKVAHHLAVYDYYGLGWFTPRYYPQTVARTLPYLPSVAVKGFYCESYPYWAHMAPQLYLASRLLWNPTQNAEEVLDTWFHRMFREVSSEIRRYFELLAQGWRERPHAGQWFQGLDRLHVQLAEWSPQIREEAWACLCQASERANTDLTRQRVEYIRRGNQLARGLSRTLEVAHGLKTDQLDLDSRLNALLDEVRETLHVYHTHIEPDLTYGAAYYRGERAERQISWWLGYLAALIQDVLPNGNALPLLSPANSALAQRMFEEKQKPEVGRRIAQARELGV